MYKLYIRNLLTNFYTNLSKKIEQKCLLHIIIMMLMLLFVHSLDEKYRPVKLERVVIGYPFKEGTSEFRFDMNLSYRLRAIIEQHCHGKPTLVVMKTIFHNHQFLKQ